MPSYKVVFADEGDFTLEVLTEKVNEYLAAGWKCTGGISVLSNSKGALIAAFQSMVKN